jgi:transcriptional antiterminator Rof (Rho-off)
MKTTTCPKCCGKKSIDGFSHIENGVCFQCSGSGVIALSAERSAEVEAVAQDTAKKREWLKAATAGQIAALPVDKMVKAFHFAATSVGAFNDADLLRAYNLLKRRMATI